MNRFLFAVLILLSLGLGFAARGWLLPASATAEHDDHTEEHGDEHDHEEESHVGLTEEAFNSLGLRVAPVEVSDYQQSSRVLAEVAEYPGLSAYKLAAPVHGEVVRIAAQPGASVDPGDPLFEVKVTDERVLDAQLKLLESLTRREIVETELARLAPLAASGAVPRRQQLDLEYERRELDTTIDLRREELLVRGLSDAQVDYLVDSKRLLRSVIVRAPRHASAELPLHGAGPPLPETESPVRPVAWRADAPPADFSVESLLVEPGQTVERGQTLCDLASHSRLYLRGHAFENDLPLLASLADAGKTLSAEFGHSLTEHAKTSQLVTGLKIRYVANQLEQQSRTYLFYMPLENEVLYESTDASGTRFRTWRYSVGQRAHVLLPTERIEGQIVLPIEAVAFDGANAFVFIPVEDHGRGHTHEPGEICPFDDEEDHDHAFAEFEPMPVKVMHRDRQQVVVATGGQLKPGAEIAMNGAYQLLLALRSDSSGGGHDHHHDH